MPSITPELKTARLVASGQTFELVGLPPGQFVMGSGADEPDRLAQEGPRQTITLSRGFFIGRVPVTQAQYRAIMGNNPSRAGGPDDGPVNQVTFRRALEFCRRLSEQTGHSVVLPTEAQWEYACRAGTTTRFHGGDAEADLDRIGWFRDNAGEGVHPVGAKEPNAWGLCDMHGNVWEMCRDILPPFDTLRVLTDPVGECSSRKGIMRGGGWMNDAGYCRAATRFKTNDRFGGTGIRIAVDLPDLPDLGG